MDAQEQIFQFSDELDRLVERFRQEYDELHYASVVGVLQMKSHILMEEAIEQHNKDKE